MAQGKFFDIYVDDNLLIVHDQRVYEDGCFGLHAAGAAQFRQVQAVAIQSPEPVDWQYRCQPWHLFKK